MFSLNQDNYTALHLAVESGQHEVVETLLGEGANVHIQGKNHLRQILIRFENGALISDF